MIILPMQCIFASATNMYVKLMTGFVPYTLKTV